MTEMVALYDELGQPCGTAPRALVRRDNLRHGATAVVLRDPVARVYVHRRTEDKDVFPGMYDFCAGGVITAGEGPAEAAARELAEELGVEGVPLEPVTEDDYADEQTRYRAFVYLAHYDGPVTWQASEVAWGDWWTVERLLAALDDPAYRFVPDSSALATSLVRGWAEDRVELRGGWDSHTHVLEGRVVERVPRRTSLARQLLVETRLMPRLAPRLPIAVPVPRVVTDSPLTVRHPIVPGEPITTSAQTAVNGRALGEALEALHATPVSVAAEAGVLDVETSERAHAELLERMRAEVLPLLRADERLAGEQLLGAMTGAPRSHLVHADLGPAHVLCVDGRLSGVIDWSDAEIGDPALDLAWVLHGTAAVFADALMAGYDASDELVRRGLLWHRLGPWHEVVHGLDGAGREFVASGLAGVRARL